jgi:muramoyltetrapeptide carboxypeptidase LdcA involved in peptidoglycan recycling
MSRVNVPKKLNYGDTIAFVALSSGLAGEKGINWRVDLAKERLENMGFIVKIMPHTLCDKEFIYNHPELRAQDLMDAFLDQNIKAIITTTGGNDSIRMLPHLNFESIASNPKIFTGFSDSTITHLICQKCNIVSYYGIDVLHDLAENVHIPQFTLDYFTKIFMNNKLISNIQAPLTIKKQGLRWDYYKKDIEREDIINSPLEFLNSNNIGTGRLIGGCLEVLNIAKGTAIFPSLEQFEGTIFFIETSGVKSPPWLFEDSLRNLGAIGILNKINGLIVGKPFDSIYYEEYKEVLLKILAEFHCTELPVIFNFPIGHNEPKTILPIGITAQINPIRHTFSLLEPTVK